MNETCESYVVNRLQTEEKKNLLLSERNEELELENKRLSATLITIKDILSRRAKIKCLQGGSKYVEMTIWARRWEPDQLGDYETLLSLVDIQEEIEEETEEEDGRAEE